MEGVVKNIDEVHKIIEELNKFDLPMIDENALLKLTGDFVFYNYRQNPNLQPG